MAYITSDGNGAYLVTIDGVAQLYGTLASAMLDFPLARYVVCLNGIPLFPIGDAFWTEKE